MGLEVARGFAVRRPALSRKCESSQCRAKTILKLGPLLPEMVVRPDEELGHGAIGKQGKEENHLAPSVGGVLQDPERFRRPRTRAEKNRSDLFLVLSSFSGSNLCAINVEYRPMRTPLFLRKVIIQNYKSIAACSVDLHQLTFLVGPNGAGKSNFVDALRFVSDALRTSLDNALRERGGINEVRRRSSGHPTHFGMRLDFEMSVGAGHYSFLIGALTKGGYEVQKEQCLLRDPSGRRSFFTVARGNVVGSSFDSPPAGFSDRLYLVNISGRQPFRPIFDAFSNMGFYNLNPQVIRELQSPEAGDLLRRDGSNLTSVVARMMKSANDRIELVQEYLSKVSRNIRGVTAKAVGPKETLEFRQDVAGAKYPWKFFAANMSDGTLRALGVLVALFQADHDHAKVPLVGIEEPEVALHPAAAGVLLDALREASSYRQVIVTSHSPDLLDSPDVSAEDILSVTSDGGITNIAPIDDAGRRMLHERLYTPGELLRLNQISPRTSLFEEPSKDDQLSLFDLAVDG